MASAEQLSGKDSSPQLWKKLAAAGVLIVLTICVLLYAKDRISLDQLVRHEAAFQRLQRDHPVWVYGTAFLLYVVVTGLSLPAGTVLTLFYGWYFGFWRAVIIVSFSSTAGATLAFLSSRFILRDFVQRTFARQLSRINSAFARDGATYLLTLRLLPVVPFFVVNAVMGLTPIRVRTFWWASQLGMLPATAVYVYAGSSAPDLKSLADQGLRGLPWGQIAFALTLLGLLPLAGRWLQARLQKAGPVS